MSMLNRYKKSGGFLQLLQLIETCGPKKQEKLLETVESEDFRWAQAVKSRLLTVEKIMDWEIELIREITAKVQELSLAVACHGLSEEHKEKIMSTLSHSQKRRLEDQMASRVPSTAEISSAYMKIISEVRQLICNGYLKAELLDPSVQVPDSIEDKLENDPMSVISFPGEVSSSKRPTKSEDGPPSFQVEKNDEPKGFSQNSPEAMKYREEIRSLQEQVAFLKSENHELREKLDGIKKVLKVA